MATAKKKTAPAKKTMTGKLPKAPSIDRPVDKKPAAKKADIVRVKKVPGELGNPIYVKTTRIMINRLGEVMPKKNIPDDIANSIGRILYSAYGLKVVGRSTEMMALSGDWVGGNVKMVITMAGGGETQEIYFFIPKAKKVAK